MVNEIDNIALTLLPNGAHYNFIRVTLEWVEENETIKVKIPSDIAALKTAFEKEGEQLKVRTKSELTKAISQNDTLRDGSYTGYKRVVKGFLSLPEGNVRTAAERLWEHLKSYNISSKDQLDKQTGLMTSFIDELENKYSEDVNALGLSTIVAAMKEANDKVCSLMLQRDSEQSKKVTGATKAARFVTDEAYRMLIKKVNALALIEGDEPYLEFINAMNTQILRYKREVLAKPSSAKAEEPES